MCAKPTGCAEAPNCWPARSLRLAAAVITAAATLALAPPVHADDSVMYEVRSPQVHVADIFFTDVYGEHLLQNEPLPWRANVSVVDPHGAGTVLRVDWHSEASRYKWVTIRIFTHGSLLCENTLDSGEARCDGRGPYADQLPTW